MYLFCLYFVTFGDDTQVLPTERGFAVAAEDGDPDRFYRTFGTDQGESVIVQRNLFGEVPSIVGPRYGSVCDAVPGNIGQARADIDGFARHGALEREQDIVVGPTWT